MKSEQIEKALVVLAAAQHSHEEGMLHTCDSMVNEAVKQLLDYQSLRLFDQKIFREPLKTNLKPVKTQVLGN